MNTFPFTPAGPTSIAIVWNSTWYVAPSAGMSMILWGPTVAAGLSVWTKPQHRRVPPGVSVLARSGVHLAATTMFPLKGQAEHGVM